MILGYRFQDKIHDKISKRTDITSEIETSNKSKNAIKRNIRSNSFQVEVAKSDYQTEVKENRMSVWRSGCTDYFLF